MVNPPQDLVSLVDKIGELEERQNVTAKYAVGLKRQLNELTKQFNHLQKCFEEQLTLDSLNEDKATNQTAADVSVTDEDRSLILSNSTDVLLANSVVVEGHTEAGETEQEEEIDAIDQQQQEYSRVFTDKEFKIERVMWLLNRIYAAEEDPLDVVISAEEFREQYKQGQRDFSRRNLTGIDLSGERLHGVNLNEANLSGANFIKADLRNAQLIMTDLSNANLSETRLTAQLIRIGPTNANLSKANLKSAIISSTKFPGANMSGINLVGLSLNGFNLSGVTLTEAKLCGVSLISANLSGANFTSADLRGADLACANLEKANLKDAQLGGAILGNTNFSGAIMPDGSIHE